MKHLAAMNVAREVGPDTYAPTSFSNALTEENYRNGIIYTYVRAAHGEIRPLYEYRPNRILHVTAMMLPGLPFATCPRI